MSISMPKTLLEDNNLIGIYLKVDKSEYNFTDLDTIKSSNLFTDKHLRNLKNIVINLYPYTYDKSMYIVLNSKTNGDEKFITLRTSDNPVFNLYMKFYPILLKDFVDSYKSFINSSQDISPVYSSNSNLFSAINNFLSNDYINFSDAKRFYDEFLALIGDVSSNKKIKIRAMTYITFLLKALCEHPDVPDEFMLLLPQTFYHELRFLDVKSDKLSEDVFYKFFTYFSKTTQEYLMKQPKLTENFWKLIIDKELQKNKKTFHDYDLLMKLYRNKLLSYDVLITNYFNYLDKSGKINFTSVLHHLINDDNFNELYAHQFVKLLMKPAIKPYDIDYGSDYSGGDDDDEYDNENNDDENRVRLRKYIARHEKISKGFVLSYLDLLLDALPSFPFNPNLDSDFYMNPKILVWLKKHPNDQQRFFSRLFSRGNINANLITYFIKEFPELEVNWTGLLNNKFLAEADLITFLPQLQDISYQRYRSEILTKYNFSLEFIQRIFAHMFNINELNNEDVINKAKSWLMLISSNIDIPQSFVCYWIQLLLDRIKLLETLSEYIGNFDDVFDTLLTERLDADLATFELWLSLNKNIAIDIWDHLLTKPSNIPVKALIEGFCSVFSSYNNLTQYLRFFILDERESIDERYKQSLVYLLGSDELLDNVIFPSEFLNKYFPVTVQNISVSEFTGENNELIYEQLADMDFSFETLYQTVKVHLNNLMRQYRMAKITNIGEEFLLKDLITTHILNY
jgi:hypothetical protein